MIERVKGYDKVLMNGSIRRIKMFVKVKIVITYFKNFLL